MTRAAQQLEPRLVCPGCGADQPSGERFCPACHLPLVLPAADVAAPPSERQRRARLIKPQLSEGRLVKAAWARNETEAEFIQALLLDEGVPSLVRRSAGFDVPDFLAAGPRDVLVPISGLDVARQVLLRAEVVDEPGEPSPRIVAPGRLLAGILLALALGAIVIWVIGRLAG